MSYSHLHTHDRGSLDEGLSSQDTSSLLQNAEEKVASSAQKSRQGQGPHRNYVLITSIVAALCTLTNIGLVVFWQNQPTPTKHTALSNGYDQLEVANSYIKLDTAIYDLLRTPPKPIKNFPLVVSRINAQDPQRVYTDTTHWLSRLGLVYPEENEVTVTSSYSTIMQFRTLDFGMERCSVVLSIDASSYRYQSGSKIDIWELKAPRRLDPRSISWTSRPSRNRLFSSMALSVNTTGLESPEFRCSSGSLHAFEFACSDSEACQLEYRQDAKKHDLGIYIKQQSSI
ncbi:hypothetical protein BKA70DRAFT_550193 [Coprinopsis sp. MPI-PUGE-AT-0042]|nr:hypothetical protein BKA70DRAFT_550193 [Coprinopsis sp. MPI-PUGE-AT-0042]